MTILENSEAKPPPSCLICFLFPNPALLQTEILPKRRPALIDTRILCSAPRTIKIREEEIENPSLHDICVQVSWATAYAQPHELNEQHKHWKNYIGYTEWFRNRICVHLEIPLDTTWEELYRITGALIDEEYPSLEDAQKSSTFGRDQRLFDELAAPMFRVFESEIKPFIVNRL